MKFIREYYDEGGAKCTEYTINSTPTCHLGMHTTDSQGSLCKYCRIDVYKESRNHFLKIHEDRITSHLDTPKPKTVVKNGKFVIENE